MYLSGASEWSLKFPFGQKGDGSPGIPAADKSSWTSAIPWDAILLSFCTFSIIPDANCCQLQHYLLSLCCQTGFLCPSGRAALAHTPLALQWSVVGRRGCTVSTLTSEWVGCCSSLVGFLLRRASLGMSSGKMVWLTRGARVHVEHKIYMRQNVKVCACSLWEVQSLLRVCVHSVSGHLGTQPLMSLLTSACWCHASLVVNELPCTGEGWRVWVWETLFTGSVNQSLVAVTVMTPSVK